MFVVKLFIKPVFEIRSCNRPFSKSLRPLCCAEHRELIRLPVVCVLYLSLHETPVAVSEAQRAACLRSRSQVQEIVVGRGKILELLRPDDDTGKLLSICSTEIFGVVRTLIAFRLVGACLFGFCKFNSNSLKQAAIAITLSSAPIRGGSTFCSSTQTKTDSTRHALLGVMLNELVQNISSRFPYQVFLLLR